MHLSSLYKSNDVNNGGAATICSELPTGMAIRGGALATISLLEGVELLLYPKPGYSGAVGIF
jgi:hypothetical protein